MAHDAPPARSAGTRHKHHRGVGAMERIRMSGVKHDDTHSLLVDRVLSPGIRESRTFWCTCGTRLGELFDSRARAVYRAHRASLSE